MSSELTLLLNSDYRPIRTIPWTKAITLLYSTHSDGTPKVALVEEYNREIKTQNAHIKVPAVIALTRYYNIFNFYRIRFSSGALYQRDQYKCAYCGNKFSPTDLTKDHIIPRAHFRKGMEVDVKETSWQNVVSACRPCNLKKGPRTPEEAGMELLTQPFEPNFVTLVNKGENMPKEWVPYVR